MEEREADCLEVFSGSSRERRSSRECEAGYIFSETIRGKLLRMFGMSWLSDQSIESLTEECQSGLDTYYANGFPYRHTYDPMIGNVQ